MFSVVIISILSALFVNASIFPVKDIKGNVYALTTDCKILNNAEVYFVSKSNLITSFGKKSLNDAETSFMAKVAEFDKKILIQNCESKGISLK